MNVYRTNMALGYNHYAHLIRLNKSKEGHNYLSLENVGDTYQAGVLVENYADFEIELTNKKIDDFPISDTYLFKLFIETFPFDSNDKDLLYLDKAGADFADKIKIREEQLLPSHYIPVKEPTFLGSGSHNIRKLEEIVKGYRELLHQKNIREKSLLKILNAEIV